MANNLWQTVMRRGGGWIAAGAAGIAFYFLVRGSRLSLTGRVHERIPSEGPRIVILGAGFAGLGAAGKLRHLLGDKGRITLVDRHNYHLFTPLLSQVASSTLPPHDVAFPIREFSGRHGVCFRRATVTGIDWDKQQVQLEDGELGYDYLVITLGSVNNFFGNKGAEEHAMPMKTLESGVAIRNHILDLLERASEVSDLDERKAMLTMAVVGGGPSGVETAAGLADLLHICIPTDYPGLDPTETQVVLIQSDPKLVGQMGDDMANLALKRLRAMGVEVWLNTRAKEIGPDHLTTEDGRTLNTRTIIWATGVRIPEVVAKLDAEHGKGGSLVVDEYLQVKGHLGVWAAGDNASIADAKTKSHVPLLAQAALQEGHCVAENIARTISGQPQVPFHFSQLGNALQLGGEAGAVKVRGFLLNGFAGWVIWWLFHLYRLSGFRGKLVSALDWGIGYVYNPGIARLELEPTGREEAPRHAGQSGQ